MVIWVEQGITIRINQHVNHTRGLSFNISFDNGV